MGNRTCPLVAILFLFLVLILFSRFLQIVIKVLFEGRLRVESVESYIQ